MAQVPFDLDPWPRGVVGGRLHGAAIGGHEAAEPVAETIGIVHPQLAQRLDHALHRGVVDLVRVLRWGEVGIGVAQRVRRIGGQRIHVIAQQFRNRRRAHAHRESQAGILGDAVVGHAGRQVEHVARRQHPVVRGIECAQQLQFDVVAERQRWCVRGIDLPAPVALRLQQEYVVLVHVRADRAAGRGEADHHVVDPPARQEVEAVEQGAQVGVPLVHVLDQQGPVVVRQAGEVGFRERSVAYAPAVAGGVVLDQARQHAVLAGQPGQVFWLQRRLVTGKRIADQQRLLLPVVAQELGGGHAEEMLAGGVDFDHGAVPLRSLSSRVARPSRPWSA